MPWSPAPFSSASVFPAPDLQGLVDAHGDVAGLFVDGGQHRAGVAVEAVFGPVVADVNDHVPDDFGDVHIAAGGNFAHDHDHTGGGAGLAGHPAHGVLLQDRVQNRVGNLVADFVGMSFRDGLRRKQIFGHCVPSFPCAWAQRQKRAERFSPLPSAQGAGPAGKTPAQQKAPEKSSAYSFVSNLISRLRRRNWHLTGTVGCRGFTGPVPPPLLIR